MPTTIAATRDTAAPEIEAQLRDLPARMAALPDNDKAIELRLPSQSSQILADVWLAIAAGTAAANWPTTLIARGFGELDASNPFLASLAGLAALQTADRILPEKAPDQPLDAVRTLQQLMARDGGLVRTRGGGQILLEADPDFPVAPRLRAASRMANETAERRRMFTQLVLHLRKHVEIGALRRMIDPVSEGPGGAVGRFLFELHENGLKHGSRDGGGRKIPGTRMLRLRKHIANNPDELAGRHGGVAELRQYLERLKTSALVEASVSDFGLGIIDGFLGSATGKSHIGRNRRTLLDELLFERLSSNGTDPAAGLGIQRALRAASQMQGFVSVRTAEFWLAASFADPVPDIRMVDVDPGIVRAPVQGTHWQILWPQP